MVQAVIFDMDGLMLDTETLYEKAWIEYGKKLGINITVNEVAAMRGQNAQKIKLYTESLFGKQFCFENARDFCYSYIRKCSAENTIKVKTGLLELLDFLKENNIKTALATSTEKRLAEEMLARLGLLKYFDVKTYGDMVKKSKPEPDIFILAANRLNCSVENCLVLEDSPTGVTAGFRAGCNVIMVPDMDVPDEKIKSMTKQVYQTLVPVIDYIKKQNETAVDFV